MVPTARERLFVPPSIIWISADRGACVTLGNPEGALHG